MNENDQKLLARLINRTGAVNCSDTVLILAKAAKRFLDADKLWKDVKNDPPNEAHRAASFELLESRRLLAYMVTP